MQQLHRDIIMMMMMMSRFVERVLNSPRARCQSAEQVSSERRGGESCGSQGGWLTVPDNWTCYCETPHPERGPCPWYGQ